MKLQPEAVERKTEPCSSCHGGEALLSREIQRPPSSGLVPHSAPTLQPESLALSLLEIENSGLRRMVVELLEKNQKLREQVRVKIQ